MLYKAYIGLARSDTPVNSLKAWLLTVASRTVIDEFRKRDEKDLMQNAVPLNQDITLVTPGPEDAGQSQAMDARNMAIGSVLVRLDSRNRTLIEMSCMADCSRDEIAEATGIPKKQITQYIKRAKEQFLKIAREYPILVALERDECEGDANGLTR